MRQRPVAVKEMLLPRPAPTDGYAPSSYFGRIAFDAMLQRIGVADSESSGNSLRYYLEVSPVGTANPWKSVLGESQFTATIPDAIYSAAVGDPNLASHGGQVVLPSAWRPTAYSIISSGSGTMTSRLRLAGQILIYLPPTFPRTPITATITATGSGGFTRSVTIPADDYPLIMMDLPTPWDELRDVTVTWSGGCSAPAAIYPYAPDGCWPLCAGIPAGWTQLTSGNGRMCSRRSPLTRYLPHSRLCDIRTSFQSGLHAGKITTVPSRTLEYIYGSRSPIGCWTADDVAGSSHRRYSLIPHISTYEPLSPANPMLGYIGFPFWNGSQFRAASPHLAANLSQVATSVPADFQVCRGNRLVIGCNSTTAYSATVLIRRASDWSFGGTSVTELTFTYSHPGDGAYHSQSFALSDMGPHAQHAYLGHCRVSMSTVSGSLTASGFLVVMVSDPVPLPIDIPCDDGTATPGAYHAGGSSPVKGLSAVNISGSTATQDDVPSDVEGFYLRFTGRSVGYYTAPAQTHGGLWDCDEVTYRRTWADEASQGAPENAILVPDGGNLLFTTQANFGKDSLYTFSITPIRYAITPYALSLGANNLTASATTWGVSPPAGTRVQHHCKFTAPADGTYMFTLTYADQTHADLLEPHAIWCSTIVPECTHEAPDAAEIISQMSGTPSPLPPRNDPPTSTAGVQAVPIYIVGSAPTGAWAGHAGEMAWAFDPGITGYALQWMFTPLAERFIRQWSGGQPHQINVGGSWLLRADNLVGLTRTMVAGETLYLRIGMLSLRGWTRRRLGDGFAFATGNTRTLTVSTA